MRIYHTENGAEWYTFPDGRRASRADERTGIGDWVLYGLDGTQIDRHQYRSVLFDRNGLTEQYEISMRQALEHYDAKG